MLQDTIHAEVFAFDQAGGCFIQRAARRQADDLGAGDVYAMRRRLALNGGKRFEDPGLLEIRQIHRYLGDSAGAQKNADRLKGRQASR